MKTEKKKEILKPEKKKWSLRQTHYDGIDMRENRMVTGVYQCSMWQVCVEGVGLSCGNV